MVCLGTRLGATGANSRRKPLLFLCFLSFFSSPVIAADQASSLSEAFEKGQAEISFRYRAEQVDQDGFNDKALASTLLTRLSFKTLSFHGTSLVLEVDDLSFIGDDRFNSTRNRRTTYPVIADPDGIGVNQAYLNFQFERTNSSARIGRQRVNRGNQRFVGGVGWRQNEQTFDAIDLQWKLDTFSLNYTYVSRVARIFGPDAGTPPASLDADTHFLNGQFDFSHGARVATYAYFLDFEDAASASNKTFGVRLTAAPTIEGLSFPLAVEFADQKEHGNNPADYSVHYLALEAGVTGSLGSLSLGQEILEGSATGAFSTPLATLHKFQGWADKFLSTPLNGIDDRYVTLKTRLGAVQLMAGYHWFEADVGGANFGDELDVSVSWNTGDHLKWLVKAARYDADTYASDTTKAWLMLTVTF